MKTFQTDERTKYSQSWSLQIEKVAPPGFQSFRYSDPQFRLKI